VELQGEPDEGAQPPVEPEEGFGDGGGGCEHPECAMEHVIAHNIESIAETIAAFDYQGWELSPRIQEMLRGFGEALVESFVENDKDAVARSLGIIVGQPYPTLESKDEDDITDK